MVVCGTLEIHLQETLKQGYYNVMMPLALAVYIQLPVKEQCNGPSFANLNADLTHYHLAQNIHIRDTICPLGVRDDKLVCI